MNDEHARRRPVARSIGQRMAGRAKRRRAHRRPLRRRQLVRSGGDTPVRARHVRFRLPRVHGRARHRAGGQRDVICPRGARVVAGGALDHVFRKENPPRDDCLERAEPTCAPRLCCPVVHVHRVRAPGQAGPCAAVALEARVARREIRPGRQEGATHRVHVCRLIVRSRLGSRRLGSLLVPEDLQTRRAPLRARATLVPSRRSVQQVSRRIEWYSRRTPQRRNCDDRRDYRALHGRAAQPTPRQCSRTGNLDAPAVSCCVPYPWRGAPYPERRARRRHKTVRFRMAITRGRSSLSRDPRVGARRRKCPQNATLLRTPRR